MALSIEIQTEIVRAEYCLEFSTFQTPVAVLHSLLKKERLETLIFLAMI